MARFHKLVPGFLFAYSGRFTQWFFGVKTEAQKKLLAIILKETDPEFRNWAINALLTWNRDHALRGTISIHGSEDRLIPIRNVAVDFALPGAGHFLTVTHAKEVSELLRVILKQ